MGETKLIHIILLSVLYQLTIARPFTFPDGTRTNGSSRSGQHPEPEGRSIRGGYSQDKRQDLYSRYNVYEHEEEDYRKTTTTFRPYVTIGTTKQSFNRHPNANYNRLPPAKNDEPIEAEPEDDYDDDGDAEDGIDPPPSNAAEDFSSSGTSGGKPVTFNNLLFTNSNNKFGGFGNLFGEDRRKHRFKFKRRRPGQPCIPYDLFNKLRTGRDSNGNRIDPKTLIPPLNLVLADVNYYSPSNNYNGHGGASDTGVSDTGTSGGGAIFNNHFYDAVGGYPCTGGYTSHRPHGGPLGFFGQGGLFDWTSSADSVQSDTGEGGSSNKPTVVFNLNDAIDSVATNWRPGQSFQMMMNVISEFISSVAGGGGGVPVVGDAVDTVRQVNKEFVSLFT